MLLILALFLALLYAIGLVCTFLVALAVTHPLRAIPVALFWPLILPYLLFCLIHDSIRRRF